MTPNEHKLTEQLQELEAERDKLRYERETLRIALTITIPKLEETLDWLRDALRTDDD